MTYCVGESITHAILWEAEGDSAFDGASVGDECSNGDIFTMCVAGIPIVGKRECVFGFYDFALHRLREHASCAPAPNGLAVLIDDGEVVSLACWEAEFDGFFCVVCDRDDKVNPFA